MNFPRIIESVLKTKVHLTKERWEHIIDEHPIVKSYLKEIEETINFPDVIMKSKYDKEILLYKNRLLNTRQLAGGLKTAFAVRRKGLKVSIML